VRWLARLAGLAVPLLAAPLLAGEAAAHTGVTCRTLTFEGAGYSVCEVDPAAAELRLFLEDSEGRVWGSFQRLAAGLAPRHLVFAMNAGMYHPDRSPVGHYVEDGTERMRVIASAGPGNFGMLPNGVFCAEPGRARVLETDAYLAEAPACRHATQSGPMLVIDGEIHPRFIPGSSSRFLRNGVGTSVEGDRAVFAISDEPVSFHDFARLFRDRLGLPHALYFDGKVSRLWAPELGRADTGFPLGPIVGVVAGPKIDDGPALR